MWSEHAIKLSLHAAKEPTHKAARNINCGESHEGEKCVHVKKTVCGHRARQRARNLMLKESV